MANYLFVYYGGKMETDPAKAAKAMDIWNKWFKDNGKSIADMGAPTKPGKVINSKGIKTGVIGEAITGYGIIKADSLDDAASLAKTNPQIAAGGQIAVYELMPM
jgi:hypothetical protein